MSEVLARYTFLPWLRKGLAAKIEEEDNLNDFTAPPVGGWVKERPEIEVRVNIEAKKGSNTTNDFIDQNIALVGPGDIIGIDHRLIVKTEPRDWVTNFEPNYFPYLEFYEPTFPWSYSPAKAVSNKLRPWLVLVALKEEEFKKDTALFGPLPSILVKGSDQDPSGTTGASSSLFPNPSQTWAWAHVHLNGDVDPTNNLDPTDLSDVENAMGRFKNLLNDNPDQAVSRIICPRILEPNTTYHCFLLPAFETGRLAGLGADPTVIATHDAQESSFGTDHLTDADHSLYKDHFPYYYAWQFMTGEAEDFESLVKKLVPKEVDPTVGSRPMDIQEPGYNVSFDAATAGDVPNSGIVRLEGALLPPFGASTRTKYPADNSSESLTYRKRLGDLLNLGEDLMEAVFPPSQFYGTNPFGYTSGSTDIEDDPIITPELYGRWHALVKTLDTDDNPVSGALANEKNWPYELNLDPRSRAVAGLGVTHIKQNQERLMDQAWEQMGDIIEANRKLKWGQFAQRISYASFNKHISSQQVEQANPMVAQLYKRVKIGTTTAYKTIKDSALPNATQSYAFRRIERPRGPVMKRIDPLNNTFGSNNLRVELANKNILPVAAKVFSPMQARMERTDVQANVGTIANHLILNNVFAPTPPGTLTISPNVEAEVRFHSAIQNYQGYFAEVNWEDVIESPAVDLATMNAQIMLAINPISVLPSYLYDSLVFTGTPYTSPPANKIVPVMAYPVFKDPLYESVKELGVDFLIPNLHLIPNNTVTLLESNQRFIEAYMMGVNHEMGRELLWREFPTDQRGSYFRHFWDSTDKVNTGGISEVDMVKESLDVEELHEWRTNTLLGSHSARTEETDDPDTGLLVMVIRGDLLKKFPDTIVYAQKAKFGAGADVTSDPRELDTEKKYPIFSATIEPDITFFGFDLVAEEARGDRDTPDPADAEPGWFFIIQERPGEIRFGLDLNGDGAAPATWNDLDQSNAAISGQHLNAADNAVVPSGVADPGDPLDTGNEINNKQVNWGFNSTHFAQILYQNPVLFAVHGDEMIP